MLFVGSFGSVEILHAFRLQKPIPSNFLHVDFLGLLWYIGPLGSKRDPKKNGPPTKISDFVQPARDLMKQSWELSYLGSRSD